MKKTYLPEDILQQIFLRMPTKPLVRLKCLSKQWNRTISDPLFMKSRSRRMIFLSAIPSDDIHNTFHAIDNTNDPSMIKLRFPFENLESKLDINIVGSVNGIILLVIITGDKFILHNHHMILYNPFSGEFKTGPDLTRSVTSYDNCGYGFGYGTNTDDLKIVRIKNFISVVGVARSSYEVFNLKDWSWSEPLESMEKYNVFTFSGKFVNGFFYWYACNRKTPSQMIILGFDIKNMVFSEIEVPNADRCVQHLDTYKGRLCIICKENNEEECGLWVMNEHGFGKSWSMVCSFKCPIIEVRGVLDDGKLLMLKDSSNQLAIYDMFKDTYKEVNTLTSFGQVKRLHAIEYIESSISPSDICSSCSLP